MPWLTGTAFLHSIMVQERRGMLKVWNVTLICGTFSLALLGTFLVRSGILESIHAFGASTVGGPLLGLIAVVVIGSALLIVSRLDDLRSTKRIESLASREAVFLINNLLLIGLATIIFWGTFFPLISELFTGQKASLAAPWFDRYATPLAILLVLFTGIGPLLAWRQVSLGALKRLLGRPALVGLGAAVALFVFTGARSAPLALILFSLAAFTLAALVQEFARGAAAYRSLAGGSYPRALVALCARNRRRYGGYGVHAGVAVLLIAVAASSSFQTSRDLRLSPGQSATVDHYTIKYVKPTAEISAPEQRLTFGAVLTVTKDGSHAPLPVAELLRRGGAPPVAARSGASSRRGDQRGRAQDHRRRRPVDRDAARPHVAQPDDQRRRPPPGEDCPGRLAAERQGRTSARLPAGPGGPLDREALPEGPAAGGLPGQRQPAGHLDLGRGSDRRARRPGRDLARA
jgi:cytochrome c-type biogenesis protein CcmF